MLPGLKGIQLVLKNVPTSYKLHFRTAVDLVHVVHGPPLSSSVPLIIVHGFLGNKNNWTAIGRTLAGILNKTVVAIDLRNHGVSPHHPAHTYPDMAEDIVQLMKKLNISKADLIGHSMGGRTGMFLALTNPNIVNSLVVIDISPVSTPIYAVELFSYLLQAMKCVNFQCCRNLEEAKDHARRVLNAFGIDEKIAPMNFILFNIDKRADKTIGWLCNLDFLSKNFPTIISFPRELVLKKQYLGKTLFIGGGNSAFLPPEDLPAIKKIFPCAEVCYILDSGHSPHESKGQQEFIRVVASFIT